MRTYRHRNAALRTVLGALFFGAVMAATGDASALIALNNPFSGASATAYIGHDQASNGERVVWKKYSDGTCVTQVIGNAGTGLNDNVVVTAGPNQDTIQVWLSSYSLSWCGHTITGLNYAGRSLDINGGSKGDLLMSGTGNTWMYGNGGNDILYNEGGAGLRLQGDAGNDYIAVHGASNAGYYSGGGGDDCLFIDLTVTNATLSCGTGDDFWSGPGTMPADCERTTNPGSCGTTP